MGNPCCEFRWHTIQNLTKPVERAMVRSTYTKPFSVHGQRHGNMTPA